MAKPDAGGGNQYGQIRAALDGATNRGGSFSRKRPPAGQNQSDIAFRPPGTAQPPSQFNVPGKTMPDFGGQLNAIRGLAGGNTMGALAPTPGNMPAPGGHNFYSQRLAQTGMDPSMMNKPMIRRPMPDQAQLLAQRASMQPQGPAPDSIDPRQAAFQRMQAFRGFGG